MPVTMSPLRYPGGKTKLYPVIAPLILKTVDKNRTYVEPFAGGAGLALKLLINGDVSNIVLNDIDENIYLFWNACLNNNDALCALVHNTRMKTAQCSRPDKTAKSKRKEDAPMSNCKVIALTNQKGGVGKTTTAVNLGVSLAKQGKKVLLIDADAQANLTMALGYSRPDDIPITLSTVMQSIIDDKAFDVSQGILHHNEGVDLLPSNIELSGFEVRLINAMSRERVLKTYVNEVKKNYDYVLIDCMPSLGMITINALAAADSVVIPTQPHYLSAKGLELLLRSVSMVKRQINPKLRIDGIFPVDDRKILFKNVTVCKRKDLDKEENTLEYFHVPKY